MDIRDHDRYGFPREQESPPPLYSQQNQPITVIKMSNYFMPRQAHLQSISPEKLHIPTHHLKLLVDEAPQQIIPQPIKPPLQVLVTQRALPLVPPLKGKSQFTKVDCSGINGMSPLKTSASPNKIPPKSDSRLENFDFARIVSKESTHLLKDIHNDIQSTLRKYDEIVREHRSNKQKNDSMRFSEKMYTKNLIIEAPSKDVPEQSEQILPNDQQTLETQLKTLKEQQQLLMLMLQNNSVQEQVYLQFAEKTKWCEQKQEILQSLQIAPPPTLKKVTSSRFKLLSQLQDSKGPVPQHLDFNQATSSQYLTPSKEIISPVQESDKTVDQRHPRKNSSIIEKDKGRSVIEISLKRLRGKKRMMSQSVVPESIKNPQEFQQAQAEQIPSSPMMPKRYFEDAQIQHIVPSPVPNRFFPDESKERCPKSSGGYAMIHGKQRKTSPMVAQFSKSNVRSQEFSQKNLQWRDKVGEKIRAQKEAKRKDEMKECTFKPKLGKAVPEKKKKNESDSTQYDFIL